MVYKNQYDDPVKYKKHKEIVAKYAQKNRDKLRDITPLPDVVNPERKAACKEDMELFLKTYFPAAYYLELSADHKQFIADLRQNIITGGKRAYAKPRGTGKSTITRHALIYAILYGYSKYIVIIAATSDRAKSYLKTMQYELADNPLLIEDFPEACYPLSMLEHEARRCKSQLLNEIKTDPIWLADKIRMPWVEGSMASECVVTCSGITGNFRGQQEITKDGSIIRPDTLAIDDFQTDLSACSPSQCQKRLDLIESGIEGMTGPGVTLSAFLACTVIEKGDAADRILDRTYYPDWQGTRTSFLISPPTNMKLWDEYFDIYKAEKAGGKKDKDTLIYDATKFYMANREAMDEGAEVSWKERKEERFASAIEWAMWAKLTKPDFFAAELQNMPTEDAHAIEMITTPELVAKQGSEPRRHVPDWAKKITAHIDVQGNCLVYMLCAYDLNFRCQVIDHGTWPDQGRYSFAKSNMTRTFESVYPGLDEHAATAAALKDLYDHMSRPFENSKRDIDLILVDVNYAKTAGAVQEFAKMHQNVNTARGKYFGVGNNYTNWLRKRNGYTSGRQWVREIETKEVGFFANYWKTFVAELINLPMGSANGLSLHKAEPKELARIAESIVLSERPVRVSRKGVTAMEWEANPQIDNDPFDNLIGCYVAASICGCHVAGDEKPKKYVKPAKQISFKDRLALKAQGK